MRKHKHPEPGTEAWERLAGLVARCFAPQIRPCPLCGYPRVDGYVCGACRDVPSFGTEETP